MAEQTSEPYGVSFHDYNRTIVGYHGTTAEIAERLVDGEPFTASENDDEEAHIQICVRNPENILAVWRVRKDGHYGKDPG